MKDYQLSLIKLNIGDLKVIENQIKDLLKQKVIPVFGNIRSISAENATNKVKQNGLEINTQFNKYTLEFDSENELYFSLNHEKNIFNLGLFIRNINQDSSKVLEELAFFISSLFPDFNSFHIRNLGTDKETYKELIKISKDYDSVNYFYAADTSWINVYAAKEYRDEYYLPLPDKFYLNIPAFKVEKINNGAILVVSTKSIDDPIDVSVKVTREIIEYYKQELERYGLWKQMKWLPNWRNNYKDILNEKGFEV